MPSRVNAIDGSRQALLLKRMLLVGACALTLAACGTMDGGVNGARGPRFAELDDPNNANPNAASNNIASLTEVVNRNPNDALALNTRGAAYARAGRFSEAIADFNRAIQLDPNLAPAFLNRGLANRQTGKADLAMQDFNRPSRSTPITAPPIWRAATWCGPGRPAGGHRRLQPRHPAQSRGAEAYHGRGLAYQALGDHNRAISDFDAAIDRNPYVVPPYMGRGQSLIAVGKFAPAIEDYNAALNIDAKNGDAWAQRGIAQERLGQAKDANESYQKALLVDPNNRIASEGARRTGGGGGGGGWFR